MPIALRLDDFSTASHAPASPAHMPDLDSPHPSAAPTTDSLAAFDKGYAAGWDDATRAVRSDAVNREATLFQTFEDLGFTYHEARAHVMSALTPLLRGIVEKLLPHLVQGTLVQRLMQEMDTMVDGRASAPVDLMVAPADSAAIRGIVDQITALPLRLVEEQSVAPGQMYLRLGEVEREIDLTGAIALIDDALSALENLNREVLRHG